MPGSSLRWLRDPRGPRLERPLERPTLTTDRLTLRPHRLDDAEQWFGIQSDPVVTRYMHWPERDRPASWRHLRDRTRHTRLSRVDDFLALAVDLDGMLIGDVSLRLKSVQRTTRNVEVSGMLHPRYEGNGYASEATMALLALAFEDLRARWATALIDVRNTRSIALAERLGMQRFPLDDTTVAYLDSPLTHAARRR